MKNKQIQLAALTVAVAAGVMIQPVKAHAEAAPETEAAAEPENTSAQEQEPETTVPAQSNEEVIAGNNDIAEKNEETVNDNASKDEAKDPGTETPAEGTGETGSSAGDGAKEDEVSDSKESDTTDTTPADKKQEQGDAVIAAGDKVEELGKAEDTTIGDYNNAVKDQNDAAKDYNDTVTDENADKIHDEKLDAAKAALDDAQGEVKKAQEAVDAASSIEERNALIKKLNEAVEKQNEAAKAYAERVNELQNAKKDEVSDKNSQTDAANKETIKNNDGVLEDNDKSQAKNDAALKPDGPLSENDKALAEADSALKEAEAVLKDMEKALLAADVNDVDSYNEALRKYNEAKDSYDKAVDAYNQAAEAAAAEKTENDKAETDRKNQETVDGTLDSNDASLKANVKNATEALAKAEQELAAAETALRKAQPGDANYQNLVNAYNTAVEAYNQAAEAYKIALDAEANAAEDYNKNGPDSIESKNETVKENNNSFSEDSKDAPEHNQDAMGELDYLDDWEKDPQLLEYIEQLNKQKTSLETQGAAIAEAKAELDRMWAALNDPASADYLTRVKEYNGLVDAYNQKIDTYARGVTAYNALVTQYNTYKDELPGQVKGEIHQDNLQGSMAFRQFYEANKLEHMDVKFDAANTVDSSGKAGSYKVAGVYKDTTRGEYSISYTQNGKKYTYKLTEKNGYEFSRDNDAYNQYLQEVDKGERAPLSEEELKELFGRDLGIDWTGSAIEFYVELKDKDGKTTGFNVKLDASTVYPANTRYSGDKAYSLAQYCYKDAAGKDAYLKAYDKDGSEVSHETVLELLHAAEKDPNDKRILDISFDISGQSIYAVSAMTCDRFFWDTEEALYYEKFNSDWDNRLKHNDTGSHGIVDAAGNEIKRDDQGNLTAEGVLCKPNGLDLVLNMETLISLIHRNSLTSLKYMNYQEKIAPSARLDDLKTIGTLKETPAETTAETLKKLEAVTPLEDYEDTAEAKLNDVLQQMKQLQQELDIPEIPDEPDPEPTPAPAPETPVTPDETPDAPVSPADAMETPADAPVMPGTVQNPVEDAHVSQTLPQTGVNRAGVLGLALAGLSFLTTGLGMEIASRRGKHCKH